MGSTLFCLSALSFRLSDPEYSVMKGKNATLSFAPVSLLILHRAFSGMDIPSTSFQGQRPSRAVLSDVKDLLALEQMRVRDQLFGTRGYTYGARYHVPRKIPLRIEPKTYFANERTFLSWLSMATTLGSVGTAIAGFAVADEKAITKHGIRESTVELMALLMIPIALLMIAYALFSFYNRSENIRKKQVGFFDDQIGPVVVALVVEGALMFILFSALRDLFAS
jgi:uncharacterized membrane protein YidH (DUF202 family)